MTGLNRNHKRFIVKMIASGESPADVAELVREKFLIETTEEEVSRFSAGAAGASSLPEDLAALYREVRDLHEEEQSESAEPESEFTDVARISDLEGAGHLCVEIKDRKIVLFKSGNSIFALDSTCSHQGGPLSEGSVGDGTVTCPWHEAQFDLATGEAVSAPATEGVGSYPVRLAEEYVEVKL